MHTWQHGVLPACVAAHNVARNSAHKIMAKNIVWLHSGNAQLPASQPAAASQRRQL
jgi:hypothetical protein